MQIDHLKILVLAALLGYFVSQDFLFKWFREGISKRNKTLGKMVNCPKCLTFWFWILVFLVYQFNKQVLILIYPLSASMFSYIVYLVINKLEE